MTNEIGLMIISAVIRGEILKFSILAASELEMNFLYREMPQDPTKRANKLFRASASALAGHYCQAA